MPGSRSDRRVRHAPSAHPPERPFRATWHPGEPWSGRQTIAHAAGVCWTLAGVAGVVTGRPDRSERLEPDEGQGRPGEADVTRYRIWVACGEVSTSTGV